MVKHFLALLIVLLSALPLHAADSPTDATEPPEGNLRLTIEADPATSHPVVGEMVEVTIRAVYDRKIANEKLEIDPTNAFDWIQTRADDWYEERIDGALRLVMERHLAVWPKHAGLLHFGPARHHLTIIDRQSQRRDVVVEAQPLALSVGEYPEQKGWHFTARKLELTDELSADPTRLADGQVVTRKVTLRALGALPEHLPPRPVVSENWLITFAAPVQRDLILTDEGPVAELVWTWQFRPHTGEPGVLEPVTIPWFDTVQHKLQTVEIPALTIGYASFYTGQTPTGRLGRAQLLALAGCTGLGLILGLGLSAFRLAPETTSAGWQRISGRFSLPAWFGYLRARQRGDLLTARRLGERIGLSPGRLAALDRAIYAPPTSNR